MKLNEIKMHRVYKHITKGDITIVGAHPYDGAAFVGCYWDTEEDEEKFELFIPEHFIAEVPNPRLPGKEDPLMRIYAMGSIYGYNKNAIIVAAFNAEGRLVTLSQSAEGRMSAKMAKIQSIMFNEEVKETK